MASNYTGVDSDIRNLYRRGSGLTLRRLMVLLRRIPGDDPLWVEVREAETEELKQPDVIRSRQAAFEARNKRAKEVTDG